MALLPSNEVTLPIGLDWEGERYRTIRIDEMTGVDEENLSKKEIRNNGAKAVSRLLRRCVQEIVGLTEGKSDPFMLLSADLFRRMYVADRDFLFISIRLLGMDPEIEISLQCPNCSEKNSIEIDLAKMDVLEWEGPEDNPTSRPCVEVKLPRGIERDGVVYKDVVWNFPKGSLQERIAGLPRHEVQTATLAACLTVPDMEGPLDSETVKRMSFRDREHAMTIVSEWTPGVDLRHEAICDRCDWSWLASISPANFIRGGNKAPKRATKSGARGRLKKR